MGREKIMRVVQKFGSRGSNVLERERKARVGDVLGVLAAEGWGCSSDQGGHESKIESQIATARP